MRPAPIFTDREIYGNAFPTTTRHTGPMRNYISYSLLFLGSLISPVLAQIDGRLVRGITLSTHGNGHDWGSESIGPTLESIRAAGANWVAIHPYARISDDGSLRFTRFDPAHPPPQSILYLRHFPRSSNHLLEYEYVCSEGKKEGNDKRVAM